MTNENYATDTKTLHGLIESWAMSVRKQNIDGVLANHASDILLFDVVGPMRSVGIEEYRRSWIEQFFPWARTDGRFEPRDVSVVAGGDVAFATAFIDCAGTENGSRVEFVVRLTLGFVKRDGEWVFVHEHHSEPVDDKDRVAEFLTP